MKTRLFSSFLLFTVFAATAQTTETIRIPAGSDIVPAISTYGIYRFPAFTMGTVLFKDGSLGKELLNYNIPNDQIVYIGKKGDTLAIALPEQIKKITISGINFYFQKKDIQKKSPALLQPAWS